MRVEQFSNLFNPSANAAGQSSALNRLASALNEKAADRSPLEAAKQALQNAKDRLDQQRDERVEQALAGYKALRSRQTSFEDQLGVQRQQLEQFQSLTNRRDALSEELSAAKTAYDPGPSPELPALSPRISALEGDLAAVERDISALIERANRHASGQKQYADYLAKTGQDGYAAALYQDQDACTAENFASRTGAMVDRLETAAGQWRERVSDYCAQFGLTPGEIEGYLEERHQLGSAYFHARQRLAELAYASEQAAPPARNGFDSLELSGAPQTAEVEPDDEP